MTTVDIVVRVGSDGTLSLRSWPSGGQRNPDTRIDLSGLDGRVLRMFERWMTLRDRQWQDEEIKVFGQLLHRRLFPDDCWDWVERQAAARAGGMVRLMLAFPADQASSRLAALPWEYLCTPDRPGQNGRFLALEPWLVVSRVVPSGNLEQVDPPGEEVRILPVVGQAKNARLGRVDYCDVLTSIKEAETRPGFSMLEPILQATTDGLRAAVSGLHPHVVHFMGHGRFRDDRGAVALRDPTGITDGTGDTADVEWVEESRLARTLFPDDWSPALVVLHACEGGAVDFEERFAGLAPTLAQGGALCVVAMQYAVTNSTAVAFSTAMYAALAQGRSLDEAVRDARRAIWDRTADPRLIGVPMIYQRTAAPLFAGARQDGE